MQLALHQLLRELNQQALGPKIPQIAERAQQPQVEQRLQRLEFVFWSVPRSGAVVPQEIDRQFESLGYFGQT